MKLIHLILLALTILLFSCQQEPKEDPAKTPVSDEVKYSQQTTEEERAIIDKYVDNCADKYRYNSHQYQKPWQTNFWSYLTRYLFYHFEKCAPHLPSPVA